MRKLSLLAISSLLSVGLLVNCGNKLIDGEDRDCDGLLNDIDPDPTNNHYQIALDLDNDKQSKPFELDIDYRDFLADGYNKNLALFTSFLINNPIFLNNVYEPSSKERLPIYAQIGCHDIIKISTENGAYQDDIYDEAEAYLGHHTFTNADKKRYQFFFVTVDGYASRKGWISNFDIGACNIDGTITQGYKDFWGVDSHPDWLNHKNHKGFDITANRLMREIDQYVDKHNDQNAQRIMIFTGHSRGGAIANLLAKLYVDKNINAKSYSFNSPTVTKESNDINKYRNIFTFTNTNDIVSRVPLPNYWHYSYYGNQLAVDVTKEGSDIFKEAYSRLYLGNSKEDLDHIEKKLADLSCLEAPTTNKPIEELAKSENIYENYHYSKKGYEEKFFTTKEEAQEFVNDKRKFFNEHCPKAVEISDPVESEGQWKITWRSQGSVLIHLLVDIFTENVSEDDLENCYLDFLLSRLVSEITEEFDTLQIILIALCCYTAHAQPVACIMAICENKRH